MNQVNSSTTSMKKKTALQGLNGSARTRGKPGWHDLLYTDIAIDLGTANTLIYTKSNGIEVNEPSIVALNKLGLPVAVGRQALLMHEKSHNGLRTVRPLQHGVIADFEIADQMIQGLIKNVARTWYSRTGNMVVCVPSDITGVERRAVRNSAEQAGAKQVYLVDEPMAAAIGAGLTIDEPVGNMVVDIGGGPTEIAIIALSGIVHAQSVRLGGDVIIENIINYLRRHHNLLIGQQTAEKIKLEIGSAAPLTEELKMLIKGRDLVCGLPQSRKITSQDIREAISESVTTIVESIRKSLDQTPPEFSSDLLERGIILAGGGALLKNLDTLIAETTGLPVHIAEDPLTAVVRGTGIILGDLDHYRSILYSG